ncbi:hypothetical protein EVB81_236 [Rhizobium phage RHph_I46]|uniref:Uncharacterized protein n=1 Tax=Rhizobium phage RHph_I1_9 TaxID=2509729 RepID=A0A7S5UYL9_9CAUD|nr:hypothetical protein PP936_gp234 [Rhizobium phage RHph_I1_9]QIG69805.1 hypothetical protein EVB81_236 [Rhizobium phage RHph_I46]QIG71086.1 hypothetical protein EVB92_236 [Rhizobium phage RHph_I9]QIG73671.1 hypothetical protein EVC04_234 [Rhizobium phage RHph_I1_9]QIG76425.1 hypothetical protein EVC25_236 [Rhizobium phage RHph_I34]
MNLREMTDEELKKHEKEVRKRYIAAQEEYSAITKELEWRTAEPCESCKTGRLLAGHGGGVQCDTCNYWFCF